MEGAPVGAQVIGGPEFGSSRVSIAGVDVSQVVRRADVTVDARGTSLILEVVPWPVLLAELSVLPRELVVKVEGMAAVMAEAAALVALLRASGFTDPTSPRTGAIAERAGKLHRALEAVRRAE